MSDRKHRHHAYSLLTLGFNAALTLFATRRTAQRGLGPDLPWQDLALLAVGTHKASRLLATERVTAPIRAPVTEGEDQQEPTGTGFRRALGELVTCPYCVAPWIALAATALYVRAPAATRVAGCVIAVAAGSDFLHRGYALLRADRHDGENEDQRSDVEDARGDER